jgi:hypothetical protein
MITRCCPRHHFASRLVIGGVDLNTVRELLGHSSIETTLRYAHLAPHHKAAAVEVIARPANSGPTTLSVVPIETQVRFTHPGVSAWRLPRCVQRYSVPGYPQNPVCFEYPHT